MATANEIRHAFEEILPPSVSASSSTPTKEVQYDVFINHRGPDTKQTLAASVYDSLHRMGLRVFLDREELDLGDPIPSKIKKAMTASFLHIAILSPKYAESPWCLAELSFMLRTGKNIIPVFYNVEPKDIHWICKGKGIYADAFSNPQTKARYTSETIEDWKGALQKVSYLSGCIVKNNDDEGKRELLKTIEDYIKKHFQKTPLVVPKHSVGLDEIVEDFENFERNAFDSSKNGKLVGIVGMGGCGKTTLAKTYYNKKIFSIYKCSFIDNVRDRSKKNPHNMQKKMLQDFGFNDVEKFDNVESGKAILVEHMKSVRVFIILDDVDHQDQLEYLLPIKDSLGQGSMIVVTSRDSGVLTSWGISSIYKMKELNPKHATELFCQHAFQQPFPVDRFESFVQKFIQVCKGLPLSLKVLGGLVHGKSEEYWDDQLDKVSRILPEDIKSKLKVSFDALDEEEQEIFLDISCFFIGEEKQLAVRVWDGSGWSGLHSLETLENKCLVELNERNRITMHDHLKDLGKEIAMRRPPYRPYRLCSPQQISHIEIEGKESVLTRGIRGIKAETDEIYEELMELVKLARGSGRMFRRRLEILLVKNNYFTEELATLSAGLVWLRWVKFSHTALQSWLSLKKLRILELHDADKLEQLWSESAHPPVELRELNISGANSFLRFPSSIGRLHQVKKISLDAWPRAPIKDLPEEFCCLQSLEHLQLRGCEELISLPCKFGNLTNLRHLDLSYCKGLRMLPASFKKLIHLQYIYLISCSELTFRSDILENITKLEILNVSGCLKLQKLPPETTNLGSLKELAVDCTRLSELPDNIGQLSKLEKLRIGSNLETLPPSIGNLSSLSRLEISECAKLGSLPDALGQLTSLHSLIIINCPLTELAFLSASFSSLCSLKSINVRRTLVSRISISEQCCPSLEILELRENYQLEEIDGLPISVKAIKLHACSNLKSINPNCVLERLESLVIEECGEGLQELPNFAELVSLKKLEFRESAEQLKKIEGLENCRSLETLKAHSWWKVPVIQSMENMERLRRLELTAWNISAVLPCLQTIKKEKWPSECIICARTAPGVEAVVKSFTFPGLPVVHSCVRSRGILPGAEFLTLKCGQRRSSSEAVMICFVINSDNESTDIHMITPPLLTEKMKVRRGTWVWIGVLTQSSPYGRKEEFMLNKSSYSSHCSTPPTALTPDYLAQLMRDLLNPPDNEGLGMLVMGEEKRVVDAFYQLLLTFGESM